nr:hypothetical protein CFP56_67734 [Quercus suber]
MAWITSSRAKTRQHQPISCTPPSLLLHPISDLSRLLEELEYSPAIFDRRVPHSASVSTSYASPYGVPLADPGAGIGRIIVSPDKDRHQQSTTVQQRSRGKGRNDSTVERGAARGKSADIGQPCDDRYSVQDRNQVRFPGSGA